MYQILKLEFFGNFFVSFNKKKNRKKTISQILEAKYMNKIYLHVHSIVTYEDGYLTYLFADKIGNIKFYKCMKKDKRNDKSMK